MTRSFEKIKQKTQAFTKGFGHHIYPFPVADFAEYKGFDVVVFTSSKTGETANISGMIDYQDKLILVNDFENPKRKRFTIAHELGHLALHEQEGNKVDFRKPSNEPQEIEANMFAAELLMPTDIFANLYQKNKDSLYSLCMAFNVSMPAVNYRISKLKAEDLIND